MTLGCQTIQIYSLYLVIALLHITVEPEDEVYAPNSEAKKTIKL